MKADKRALLKRKACVLKKTMELSILCDIKACAIIVDADGTVESWPKYPTDLNPILDRYKQYSLKKQKKNNDVVVDVENTKGKENVLLALDSKIEAVKRRIEFLNGKSITAMNSDGDGEREEFAEILSDIIGGGSNSVNAQEFGPTEIQPCAYWDGEIGFSTANYDQQLELDPIEQPCSNGHYGLSGNKNNTADVDFEFDLLMQDEYQFHIFSLLAPEHGQITFC
ncbi:PREDICTED: uncharacterized protein LOC109218635 [Nicotiana attenuata]|uniref:MADS-box domain-containing protein n=1 Tax=Nicotiana attenuata TaxID=49451 RepID=A0A1J6K9J0_NICAT|nr:PREDICTED: uncharacterized protein LOC109218635 [Nicotiana attenuata]OIT21656.1 hypothetical protein A4A49_33478 [Nicotiana attenuata]